MWETTGKSLPIKIYWKSKEYSGSCAVYGLEEAKLLLLHLFKLADDMTVKVVAKDKFKISEFNSTRFE